MGWSKKGNLKGPKGDKGEAAGGGWPKLIWSGNWDAPGEIAVDMTGYKSAVARVDYGSEVVDVVVSKKSGSYDWTSAAFTTTRHMSKEFAVCFRETESGISSIMPVTAPVIVVGSMEPSNMAVTDIWGLF